MRETIVHIRKLATGEELDGLISTSPQALNSLKEALKSYDAAAKEYHDMMSLYSAGVEGRVTQAFHDLLLEAAHLTSRVAFIQAPAWKDDFKRRKGSRVQSEKSRPRRERVAAAIQEIADRHGLSYHTGEKSFLRFEPYLFECLGSEAPGTSMFNQVMKTLQDKSSL